MNGKLLILLASLAAINSLSACTAIDCPAEFARPKSREFLCGSSGDVMSTGSEIYMTPAQYQEWRRQTTRTYVPPATTPTSRAPTASTEPTSTPTVSSGQNPVLRTEGRSEELIEG